MLFEVNLTEAYVFNAGKKVKFTAIHDKSQKPLSFFTGSKQAATSENIDSCTAMSASASEEPQAAANESVVSQSENISEADSGSDTSSSESEQDQDDDNVINTEVSTDSKIEIIDGPSQPILKEYKPRKFGRETYKRDFNPEWFKLHPWLSYDVSQCQGSCYPCRVFTNNKRFKFTNWKKTKRLMKHSRSRPHKIAMAKWLADRANKKRKTSVLVQLSDEHQRQIKQNREYLRVIIECIVFTAQQNIAQRGHVENRDELQHASDINRGNFLELLHLRIIDIP